MHGHIQIWFLMKRIDRKYILEMYLTNSSGHACEIRVALSIFYEEFLSDYQIIQHLFRIASIVEFVAITKINYKQYLYKDIIS